MYAPNSRIYYSVYKHRPTWTVTNSAAACNSLERGTPEENKMQAPMNTNYGVEVAVRLLKRSYDIIKVYAGNAN